MPADRAALTRSWTPVDAADKGPENAGSSYFDGLPSHSDGPVRVDGPCIAHSALCGSALQQRRAWLPACQRRSAPGATYKGRLGCDSHQNSQAVIEGSDRGVMLARSHPRHAISVALSARLAVALTVVFVMVLALPRLAQAAPRHSTPRAMPSTITPGEADSSTAMSFALGAPSQVRAVVVREGKVARTLRSGRLRRGRHTLTWDGSGDPNVAISAGSYLFVVTIRPPGRRAIVFRSAVEVAAPRTPTSIPSLVWPVDQAVSSPFGPRGTRRHDGIDIPAAAGTAIVAAATGRVLSAGDMGAYGKTIVVQHDVTGMTTLYAHQSSLVATVGQAVVAGQVIGNVGRTGNAEGDHLHLELRGTDGVAIDPQLSLPVRAS